MLEKAARAVFDGGHLLDAEECTEIAIAVLQAIREPSEEMIEAGFRARDHGMNMSESANATWQAMIDSILSNTPTGETE